MDRLILIDAQWAKMAPHCLGKTTDPGRSGKDNRLFIGGVLWIVRTGSPWRDLPATFGNWNPVFKRYRDWVKSGIEPLVGSVGGSYDNALAETINGLFKAEVVRRRGSWYSVETVEYVTLDWVDWFNNRRLLEPIGNIPPVEAAANFYAALETKAVAA